MDWAATAEKPASRYARRSCWQPASSSWSTSSCVASGWRAIDAAGSTLEANEVGLGAIAGARQRRRVDGQKLNRVRPGGARPIRVRFHHPAVTAGHGEPAVGERERANHVVRLADGRARLHPADAAVFAFRCQLRTARDVAFAERAAEKAAHEHQ